MLKQTSERPEDTDTLASSMSIEDKASLSISILESCTEYSIIALDLDFKIIVWNEGAKRNYGYTAEDMVGKKTLLVLLTPEDIESGRVKTMLDHAFKTGKYEGVFEGLRKNGERFSVLLSMTTRCDTEGNPVGYVLISKDITDRKRSALYLEIQYAIAWILAESITLFVATSKILRVICKRLQWDCGVIWAVDQEKNVLRCTRVWQIPEIENDVFQQESQSLICSPGEGLPGQVWEERKAIWYSDILHEKNFLRKASTAKIGFNTAVGFPIIYEDKVLGLIEFFTKDTRQADPDLLLWFESIGNQFGLFLVRKRMEKQMLYLAEHDALTGLSNRKQIEQYLNIELIHAKESAQKLAVLSLDLDHFKYVNDSIGHQAGDLLLKEISERFSQCVRPQDKIS